jgi:hypothetical protein
MNQDHWFAFSRIGARDRASKPMMGVGAKNNVVERANVTDDE